MGGHTDGRRVVRGQREDGGEGQPEAGRHAGPLRRQPAVLGTAVLRAAAKADFDIVDVVGSAQILRAAACLCW